MTPTTARPPRRQPDHDPTLGDPMQPAPGVLVLSTSRIRDFTACPRRFFLQHVLRLDGADTDESGLGAAGSQVHSELRARHHDIERHDDERAVDPEGSGEPWVLARARAHGSLCPIERADYLGGEVDLRWFMARKALLVTGRVDAVWRHHDGTIEVRDYKTGSCPTSLVDDVGAAIYALLTVAALAHGSLPGRAQMVGTNGTKTGAPVRVSYESLSGEEARLVSLDIDGPQLRRAFGIVVGLADRIRQERTFPATAAVDTCGHCAFRAVCPHSVARE